MTDGFSFDATCPSCGGPLHVVTQGRCGNTEAKAIVACADNPRHGEWLISCRISHTSGHVGCTA